MFDVLGHQLGDNRSFNVPQCTCDCQSEVRLAQNQSSKSCNCSTCLHCQPLLLHIFIFCALGIRTRVCLFVSLPSMPQLPQPCNALPHPHCCVVECSLQPTHFQQQCCCKISCYIARHWLPHYGFMVMKPHGKPLKADTLTACFSQQLSLVCLTAILRGDITSSASRGEGAGCITQQQRHTEVWLQKYKMYHV